MWETWNLPMCLWNLLIDHLTILYTCRRCLGESWVSVVENVVTCMMKSKFLFFCFFFWFCKSWTLLSRSTLKPIPEPSLFNHSAPTFLLFTFSHHREVVRKETSAATTRKQNRDLEIAERSDNTTLMKSKGSLKSSSSELDFDRPNIEDYLPSGVSIQQELRGKLRLYNTLGISPTLYEARLNQYWKNIPFFTSTIVIVCGAIYFVCLLVVFDTFTKIPANVLLFQICILFYIENF